MFSEVLLTVDFDRTLTDPKSHIPQRNLDAIAFFTENGGKFTVNTGRCTTSFRKYLDVLPVNAPLLMYNGSARWENGQLTNLKCIDLDPWQVLSTVHAEFPLLNLEVQGVEHNFLVEPDPAYAKLYNILGWKYELAQPGDHIGPFLKFALAGTPRTNSVATLFEYTSEEMAAFNAAEARINELWGDKVVVYRAGPRIIDVHAKGVSKSAAARQLQKELGRSILVCVGDAENDIPMLDGADYAFCPADGIVANRYENVCNCADGAVADVIYKKIPEVLGFSLDKCE